MRKPLLLNQKGFVALYLVQFCGALNDNLFRAALLTLVAFQFAANTEQAALLNNLAMALFILPVVLLSPLAGQLADRADKPGMVRKNKWFEFSISCLALLALAIMSLPLMILVLTLLGVQSAMFGPNKYALIPQLLPGYLLARGNGAIASGTFLAITLGTLAGTWMASGQMPFWTIAALMLALSTFGLTAAYHLPAVERGAHDLSIDSNLFRAAARGIALARQDKRLESSILALSWFWLFGTGFVTQLPTWSRAVLGNEASHLGTMFSAMVVGLLAGVLAAGRTSRRYLETGFILPALIGLIICGCLFALLPLALVTGVDSSSQPPKLTMSLLLVGTQGVFGGLFLVPLYALLQQRSSLKERARIIAANNLVNSLCILAAALLGLAVFSLMQNGLTTFFLLLALSGLALIRVLSAYAQSSWRLVGAVISRIFYRLDIEGRENIPPKGPVLFVCNHLSYADSVILFGAIERPTRFIMEDKYWRIPLFNPVLRSARTIPVCSPFRDRQTFEQAFEIAAEALQAGEAVFVFPEGRLSPNGETIAFKRGFERILARAPAVVVPVAIQGLWGSWFSHGGGKPALTGWPKPGRRRVYVRFGSPIETEQPSAERLRQEVLQLMETSPDQGKAAG